MAAKRFRHLEALHGHDRQRVRRACGPAFSKSSVIRRAYPLLLEVSALLQENHRTTHSACICATLSRQTSAQALACASHRDDSLMSARAIRSKSPLRICISKALAAGTRQQKSHTPLAMMAIQGESSCISRLDHAQKTLSIFRRGSGTASAHCLFNQSSKRCQPWQMIFFTDQPSL